MKRNATLNLEGFDPEILEAARDVARRAGVPVEAWIASIVSPEQKPKARRRRLSSSMQHQNRPIEDDGVAGSAPSSPASTSAEPERSPPVKAAAAGAPGAATVPDPIAPFTTSIAEMMRRLEQIDHKIDQDHQISQQAATRTIEGIEARISTVLDAGLSPATQMSERLVQIERRMTELGEQLASPRPIGRRGRAADAEVRDAVAEIRQRQRELDSDGTPGDGNASGGAVQRSAGAGLRMPSPAISELQAETSRLRESIGGLATGRDVSALEQAMRSLVTGVQRAQEPADLAAIAAPIELIRVQVARLADDVAENVHARVATDVERLAAKVDGALSNTAPGFADRDELGNLFRELDEIRRLIASLAGPERIQSLAQGLQAISVQITELQGGVGGDGTNMAELRPLLEEIRTGLRTPASGGIEEQIQAMGAKLDALREGTSAGAGNQSDVIIGRIDALADKVERASVNPVGDLIGRLEDLGETLRRPVIPGGDLASIHGMLHDLAEKLDRVGGSAGPRAEGLDVLEKQVLALASRLDTRDADPALAALERTMSDLLTQVSALRDEAPIEAAVERATRNAVAESIQTTGDTGELGLLRASLADLRAQQAASEHRMQATLDGVHSALDKLVGRLGSLEGDAPLPIGRPVSPSDLVERLSAATARVDERAPMQVGAVVRRPEALRVSPPAQAFELGRVSDEPLEPGARRPGPERSADTTSEAAVPTDSDIKTSFIAAARRAAQAAQNEAATAARSPDLRSRASADIAPGSAPAGRAARLRAELDKRRKPLLLGLAAIVLALGALQAINTRRTEPDTSTAQVAQSKAVPVEPSESAPNAPAASAARLDPETTQSIGEASPPPAPIAVAPPEKVAQPVRRSVPRVATLNNLAGDLGAVPTGLAQLRKTALEGDGASVYDLASRAAEGRGMPRDFAVAAKLFEALADAGYAPAQYKLGGLYEKGSGVVRDLAQAKLWYGRAAEQGHARSMHNIAVIYAENPSANGKPDYTTASQWFRRGAEYGMRDSQYNLAVLYARGLGVQQDLVQSYLWFSAAAAQGDDDAGKKRDDVAAKLSPKDLASAQALSASFRSKSPVPAVNEPPAPTSAGADGSMSLIGAPPPASPAVASRRSTGA
ncbi:tetratricopeptide repeat protein [Methylobacterium sp. 77]|uniref:tetratricopeptide repeat protein n=1 Tax=Methylobacterium sp. 77 TaxID=1101192 RepID=UPI00055AC5AF|nr:tetratricopeptide repeat protein [Methylobacterium sp. 77]